MYDLDYCALFLDIIVVFRTFYWVAWGLGVGSVRTGMELDGSARWLARLKASACLRKGHVFNSNNFFFFFKAQDFICEDHAVSCLLITKIFFFDTFQTSTWIL